MSLPSELPQEPPQPQRSRVAQRLLNQPLRNLGVGVTVLILGSTALFGGLNEATGSTQEPVVLGSKLAADPFDLTLKRVFWVNELPGVITTEPGNRWLAITAVARNTSDHSVYGSVQLAEAVGVVGLEGAVAKKYQDTDRVLATNRLLVADSGSIDPVQPGLDYDMVFLFEQKADAEPGNRVTVQVLKHVWRASSLDRTEQWLDPTVIAQSTLPVNPAKPTSAPSAPSASSASAQVAQ